MNNYLIIIIIIILGRDGIHDPSDSQAKIFANWLVELRRKSSR